ncbi:MAG: phage holin family protein [Oscillospiraceae bacterium]
MINILETITAIPAITVLCLLGAQAVKSWTQLDNKHIPALCGVLGGILGIICALCFPGFIPAENPLVAAAIGAVSGWAATGLNQVYKLEMEGKS